MRILYFLLICACLVAIVPNSSNAMTLPEFIKAAKAAGDKESLMQAVASVNATNSPELIVQSERSIAKDEGNTANEIVARLRLLNHATAMTPRSRDEALWVSRAQYDLAKFYLNGKVKKKEAKTLLEKSTYYGHPKAPERLAKLVMKKKTDKARELLRLSISRGNISAGLLLADIENDSALRADAIRQLKAKQKSGDKAAASALRKYKEKQAQEEE